MGVTPEVLRDVAMATNFGTKLQHIAYKEALCER